MLKKLLPDLEHQRLASDYGRSGRLSGAELKESEFGVPYWMIPEDALEGFEKEKPGAKKARRSK